MGMKLIQVGNNFYVLLGVFATCQSFYFTTLEEYYTGGLWLGLFNGVTDGSVGVIALFLYCGVKGNDFFT
jgi:ethanolaminephosphotransferase